MKMKRLVNLVARRGEAFDLIVAAAVAGERCPMNRPLGPLCDRAVGELVRAGCIRVEISDRNWRVAVILVGPHHGKRTAPSPDGGAPWRICARRTAAKTEAVA